MTQATFAGGKLKGAVAQLGNFGLLVLGFFIFAILAPFEKRQEN
jgi:hypothetical protein